MSNKVVTLNIESNSINVLVVKGKRVDKWGSAPLEAGVVEDGVILNPEALVSTLKALLKSMGIEDRKIVTSVSGLHSVPRTLSMSKLPQKLREDVIVQEATRAMPIPSEELYLSWQALAAQDGVEQSFFAVGIPRNVLDSSVQALGRAEIKPYIMDLKPLAQVRALNRKEGLIINIEPCSFEIILVADGLPQIMRTITQQNGVLALEDRVDSIAEELGRTVRFFNSNHPEAPLSPSTPLFLTGELADDRQLAELVQASTGYPVELLEIPLKCSPDLPIHRYATNVGLALKKISRKKRGTDHLPEIDLNVLPSVYRPKRRSMKKTLLVAAVVAALGLLFPLYQATSAAAIVTYDLARELSGVNHRLQLNNVIKANITNTSTAAAAIEEEYQSITAGRHALAQNLQFIAVDALALVPGISLTSTASSTDGSIAIMGEADTSLIALDYISALGGRFSSVSVKSWVEKGGGSEVVFTIEVSN